MLKKIGYKKEPRLKVHKYVVVVNKRVKYKGKPVVHSKFFYCISLKEVRQKCEQSQKGSWVDVFKAEHNFIQAYVHEADQKKAKKK